MRVPPEPVPAVPVPAVSVPSVPVPSGSVPPGLPPSVAVTPTPGPGAPRTAAWSPVATDPVAHAVEARWREGVGPDRDRPGPDGADRDRPGLDGAGPDTLPAADDDGPAPVGWRWGVGLRTALLVLTAVVAVGAAVVTVSVARGAGDPLGAQIVPEVTPLAAATAGSTTPATTGEAPAVTSAPPTGAAGTEATGAGPGQVVVHVVGAVRRPGVVTLPPGARLEDAVDAAGGAGARADLAAVNLARLVADGEQIRIPRVGEPPAEVSPSLLGAGSDPGTTGGQGATSEKGASGAAGGTVDVNTADAAALDALPGIGPVLAARIIEHRTAHGPFASVEALEDVPGIGPALLGRLRPLVRV